MKRLLFLVLLLAPVLVADEEESLATFRLKKEPLVPMRGYISRIDEEGFRFRAFGPGGKRVSVKWSDIVPEDAKKMRIKFKLELTEDEKRGLMPGNRLHFIGGGYEEGKMSPTPAANGKHEWKEICPRCFGARQDRSIAYR